MEKLDKNGLTEEQYLAQYNPNKYEKPSVTVDMVVLGTNASLTGLKILLVKRGAHPFIGEWALPGGFVKMDESTSEAASRELEQETGLKNVYLEQIGSFSEPDRDPRMRVISISYMALVNRTPIVKGNDDAAEARWFDFEFTDKMIRIYDKDSDFEMRYNLKRKKFKNGTIPYEKLVASDPRGASLAFDHAQIIVDAMTQLRKEVMYTNLPFSMASPKFTLPDLQRIYELLLGHTLYKANFRIMVADRVESVGEKGKSIVGNRMSELFFLVG
ncbi:MAG: NUDIX hydrolase [Pseudobutyrivibrio sp.]|nr:NUDIX hydrolase [Pseudobutyrivibrio sp.]